MMSLSACNLFLAPQPRNYAIDIDLTLDDQVYRTSGVGRFSANRLSFLSIGSKGSFTGKKPGERFDDYNINWNTDYSPAAYLPVEDKHVFLITRSFHSFMMKGFERRPGERSRALLKRRMTYEKPITVPAVKGPMAVCFDKDFSVETVWYDYLRLGETFCGFRVDDMSITTQFTKASLPNGEEIIDLIGLDRWSYWRDITWQCETGEKPSRFDSAVTALQVGRYAASQRPKLVVHEPDKRSKPCPLPSYAIEDASR